MRHQLKANGLDSQYTVDSAGTGGWHAGETPHVGTREVLHRYQVSDADIFARQIKPTDFSEFDFIFAMDKANIKDIEQFAKKHKQEIRHLSLFLAHAKDQEKTKDKDYPTEVPDPYYTGQFDYVYDLVNQGCEAIIKDLTTSTALSA